MKGKCFTIFTKRSIYGFITISVKSSTFVLQSHGLMNHPLNIFLLQESKQSDTNAEQKHVWSALFNTGRDIAVVASRIACMHAHARTQKEEIQQQSNFYFLFLSHRALQGRVSTVIAFASLFSWQHLKRSTTPLTHHLWLIVSLLFPSSLYPFSLHRSRLFVC